MTPTPFTDRKHIERLYDQAMGSVRVQVAMLKTSYNTSDASWSFPDALQLAKRLSSQPLYDAFLRSSATLCVPHVTFSSFAPPSSGNDTSTLEAISEVVSRGEKLSSRLKAALDNWPDLQERFALTVAYVCNRCFPTFPAAFVPVSLQGAGEVGHANGLLLRTVDDSSVTLEIYEPNGAGGGSRVLEAVDLALLKRDVDSLIAPRRLGSVTLVGEGLQTLLGEWATADRGDSIVTTMRGYAVCSAVVLWVMHLFCEEGGERSLAQFDAALANGVRRHHRKYQRLFERFLRKLSAFVKRKEYAKMLRRLAQKTFRDSNVTEVAWKKPGVARIRAQL